MIRRAALVAAGLLLALAACDRGRPPAGFAGPAAPALFEIAGPGGAVEGWLFGTIHSLPGGVSWETETLADALAAAQARHPHLRVLRLGLLENPYAMRQRAAEDVRTRYAAFLGNDTFPTAGWLEAMVYRSSSAWVSAGESETTRGPGR